MVTVKPEGDGIHLFWTSILLLAVAWITFSTRIGVRVWRNALGTDDYLMSIGLVLFTITASLCITCAFYGSGQLAATLPASTKMTGIKLFFVAEFFYAAGATAIKCSIAVTLLRIADTRRRFVWTIWTLMVMSMIATIVFISGVANICHPITTLWGETVTGSCNLKLNSDVSFFFSAIEIVTDWSLAILPAALLWNIQMKANIKISVAGILGLAAFASCATIVRLRYLSLYSDPAEFMYATGKVGLWSIIEEGIGIFAGSLPALRPLLALAFDRGTSANASGTGAHNKSGSAFNKPRTMNTPRPIRLDTFTELDDKDLGDGDSQKHILKETQFTVQSNEGSATPGQWHKNQVLGWKNKTNSSHADSD